MASIQTLTTRLASLRPASTEPRARVQILSDGMVAGSRDMEDGEYRIGARADCDLVIPEAHFPHIALLKVLNSAVAGARLSLVPFIPGVTMNGEVIAPFAAVQISETASIAIGSTLLRLTPGGRPAKSPPQQAARAPRGADITPSRWAGLVSRIDPIKLMIAAALLCAAALVSSLREETSSVAFRSVDDAVAQAAATPKITDAAEMLKLVRHQLSVADLSDTITPRIEGKSIVVEGSVTDRQEERFRSLLAGLRRRTSVELTSQVKPVALPLQSQIAGVALAPVAMVVMQDGGRFQVGDTLPKGWRVEAISAKGVVLTRESLRETIPLGGR